MAASEQQLERRKSHHTDSLQGKTVAIDGFNLIILLESFLSRAYLFKGMDGCYRDLSGVHGTYKRIQHTQEVIEWIGQTLLDLAVARIVWYLDAPVSNSGRLKGFLLETAEKHEYPWEILLVNNPDKELAKSAHVVITSDAWILDRAKQWYNLVETMLSKGPSHAEVIDLT